MLKAVNILLNHNQNIIIGSDKKGFTPLCKEVDGTNGRVLIYDFSDEKDLNLIYITLLKGGITNAKYHASLAQGHHENKDKTPKEKNSLSCVPKFFDFFKKRK